MHVYDLFVSIGPACRPAYHLQKQLLRSAAFPLDWQMRYSLDTVLHLFETSFCDFFLNIAEDARGGSGENRWVVDETNSIISIHHFNKHIPLEEAQKLFRLKMGKRYANLDAGLKRAKKIVLIGNRGVEKTDDLKTFLYKFSEFYPHKDIRLINIRDDMCLNSEVCKESKCVLSDNLTLIEYTFNDSIDSNCKTEYNWHGNTKQWTRILEQYTLTETYEKMEHIRKSNECIIIYGAGNGCRETMSLLKRYHIMPDGIAVTDIKQNPDCFKELKVLPIECYSKSCLVIISVQDRQEQKIIRKRLLEKGYQKCMLFWEGALCEFNL